MLYFTEITPLWLVTLLSYLVSMIDCILSNRSWHYCSNFGVVYTCKINHIVALPSLRDRSYLVRLNIIVLFCFRCREDLYDRSHVVMSRLRHRTHIIQLVIMVQFRFRRKPHMYDKSRHCFVWFLSYTMPRRINHDSKIFFSE